jgi:hypothetical protein
LTHDVSLVCLIEDINSIIDNEVCIVNLFIWLQS